MFTGIITDQGRVISVDTSKKDKRVNILTAYNTDQIAIGASIACSGCCLTVVDKGRDGRGGWFAVDISTETIARTRPGLWQEGARLNLEQSLKMGDELGGHLVSGHVDGWGQIIEIKPVGGSYTVVFEVPKSLAPYIAEKGSIAIDGVSLTVNEVHDHSFIVNIIPHTWDVTTLGSLQAGDKVNVEIDMLARYVARILGTRTAEQI